MTDIPNIDLRISKGELREIPHQRLTARQYGAIAAWSIVGICVLPIIFAMLWSFGPVLGVGILLYAAAKIIS